MGLARSSYYSADGRVSEAEITLRAEIHGICAEYPRYGYRRVTALLKARGRVVNHKRIARLMREDGLQVRPHRRFVRTTDSRHEEPVFPNLARDFEPTGINQLWVADLTYVAIDRGFVYVAVILDAWSRRVVGYAVARNMEVRLTLAALEAAIAARTPPFGCIHHTDRGSQYAAKAYREALTVAGLRGSMGRRGNPYDNAFAESFMKTLKCEAVYLNDYRTFADVIEDLPRFIDKTYNTRRLHSAIGYRSPIDFEESHASQPVKST